MFINKMAVIRGSLFNTNILKTIMDVRKMATRKSESDSTILLPENGHTRNGDNVSSLHPKLQDSINKQIQKEFKAFYAYVALEMYFKSSYVGLLGFARHHRHQQKEELQHAKVLMRLLTLRGGSLNLLPIEPPQQQNWDSPADAMKYTLQVENITATGVHELLEVAENVKDGHVTCVVENQLLEEQMKCLYEANRLVQLITDCPSPECLFIVDQTLKSPTNF